MLGPSIFAFHFVLKNKRAHFFLFVCFFFALVLRKIVWCGVSKKDDDANDDADDVCGDTLGHVCVCIDMVNNHSGMRVVVAGNTQTKIIYIEKRIFGSRQPYLSLLNVFLSVLLFF